LNTEDYQHGHAPTQIRQCQNSMHGI